MLSVPVSDTFYAAALSSHVKWKDAEPAFQKAAPKIIAEAC